MPISALHSAPQPRPTALALRLNADLLHSLRQARQQNYTPKLVVQDGRFTIKVSDSVSFPCSASPETLRFDIYSPAAANQDDYAFTGTVTSRLNVLTDAKQIKDHLRVPAAAAVAPIPPSPVANTSQNPPDLSLASGRYAVRRGDTKSDVFSKFVSLLALGPATRDFVVKTLDPDGVIGEPHVSELLAAHAQSYSPNDPLIEHDTYPVVASGWLTLKPTESYYVLKDKTYKELRPWQWAYTAFERTHVVQNTNNALTRMGFSESHPLRRLIVDRTSPQKPVKKAVALGGGLLSAPKKARNAQTPVPASPQVTAVKRPHTASPRLDARQDSKPDKRARLDGSPLKEARSTYVLTSASSSEDEKWQKSKRTSSNGSTTSTTSNVSNASATSNVSNGTASTSPSSVNDDESHDEEKPKIASLPSRPSSAITNGDKKQQYYVQLAQKFRAKYQEYAQLHGQLSRDRKGTSVEKKKALGRLFELHTLLAEWKRKLWDYHNENYMAEEVMTLSKHRKTRHPSPAREKYKPVKRERTATPRRALDY